MADKNDTALSRYFIGEEIKSLKILIIGYSVFILCATVGFVGGKTIGIRLMNDWQFGIMVVSNLLSSLYAALTIHKKNNIFLAKYVLFFVMAATITLGMFWMKSSWIFLGYYLLVVMAGFFHESRICLFAGITSLLFFIVLNVFTSQFSAVEIIIWVVYFFPAIGAITLINKRNYAFIEDTFEKRQEMEEAKATLEVRIGARTKELKELSEALEDQVKERTGELKKKIGELERFNRLAVGRELKMMELKEEIKKLKVASEKK